MRAAGPTMSIGPRRPARSIPSALRDAVRARLERHVRERWPDRCRGVVVTFRGRFAYLAAFSTDDLYPPWLSSEQRAQIDAIPTRLCRLGYLGGPDRWELSVFTYSNERYEAPLGLGPLTGTPEEGFDMAAGLYLAP